jgi:hypothetical protein
MEQPTRVERQVARKLWIREVRDGELIVTEGLQPNILKTARGDVGRVNVLGVIVSAESLPTASLIVDDGTANIIVRSFERPLDHDVGEFVQVIGRPRVYQGEPYIAAEAVAVVGAGWAGYRKKELGAPQETAKPEPVQETPHEQTRETGAEVLIRIIIELDKGDGAPIEEVATRSRVKDAEAIIEQLLLAGDIFELRPGKVKVL